MKKGNLGKPRARNPGKYSKLQRTATTTFYTLGSNWFPDLFAYAVLSVLSLPLLLTKSELQTDRERENACIFYISILSSGGDGVLLLLLEQEQQQQQQGNSNKKIVIVIADLTNLAPHPSQAATSCLVSQPASLSSYWSLLLLLLLPTNFWLLLQLLLRGEREGENGL